MDFNHEENEIRIVQDNKPVTCPECGHGFTKGAELSRHIMSVHDLRFKCSICDDTFKKRIKFSTEPFQC